MYSTKKKESSKRNIPRAKDSKQSIADKQATWKYYYDYYRQDIVHDSDLDRLADRLIDRIINNPRVMSLNAALLDCGLTLDRITSFLKRSEKLRIAKKDAMFLLGSKRETSALFKEIEKDVFKQMQGTYDPMWKDQEKYFNDLRQKVNENTTKVIVMEKFKSEIDKETKAETSSIVMEKFKSE